MNTVPPPSAMANALPNVYNRKHNHTSHNTHTHTSPTITHRNTIMCLIWPS